jgi:hypothetical protein
MFYKKNVNLYNDLFIEHLKECFSENAQQIRRCEYHGG